MLRVYGTLVNTYNKWKNYSQSHMQLIQNLKPKEHHNT